MRPMILGFAVALATLSPASVEARQSEYIHSNVFDCTFYKNAYASELGSYSCGNAESHWINYGMAEGRQAHPNFSPRGYLAEYADVAAWAGTGSSRFQNAVHHYVQVGMTNCLTGPCEGRNGGAVATSYVTSSDLPGDFRTS